MKRGRFTEEQIIAVLREHEAGAKTGEQAWSIESARSRRLPARGTRATSTEASHHYNVGNAARPYFGIESGLPNRSQRAVRNLLWLHCGTT